MTLLVKRWHIKLCKHAYRYTKDLEVSKDITQDSWYTIFKKIRSIKNPDSFGSWAMMIVTRKSLDWLKKYKKEHDFLDDYLITRQLDLDGTQHNSDPIINQLRMAIHKLPKNHEIVLNLFYLDDFTIQEIGEILDISTGTVKSRLFNAREKLKEILKQTNYEK